MNSVRSVFKVRCCYSDSTASSSQLQSKSTHLADVYYKLVFGNNSNGFLLRDDERGVEDCSLPSEARSKSDPGKQFSC